MRIGMMADVYKPHVSGVTGHISLTKRALELAGHKVFVFTFGDLEYEDDELNIVRSPGLPLSDTGYYFGFRYPRHARRELQTMDVVHVHHPFLSGRLALRYCRPYGIPVVFTNHTRYDLYAQAYFPVLPDELGNAFLQAYLVSFCREVDLVIAPSAGLRDVLLGFGVDVPVEIIPNGIELSPFQHPAGRVPREQLGFSDEHVVLVYVGRLGPEKNLAFLIRAFARLVAAFRHARLLLVGDGPERENLEDRVVRSGIEGKVAFAGMVDYEALPRYLAACDAFVTASVTEVHPLSLIEALASGLPAVGVESPGVADTIVDGVNGYLAPHDLAAYTAKLARIVGEPETRRRMAEEARRCSEQYSSKRTSRLLEERYQQLLGERPRRQVNRWQMAWRRWVDRVT